MHMAQPYTYVYTYNTIVTLPGKEDGLDRYKCVAARIIDTIVSMLEWSEDIVSVHFAVGFKFSRASYLLSLLRPQIVKDLELKVSHCCFFIPS